MDPNIFSTLVMKEELEKILKICQDGIYLFMHGRLL